VASHTWPFTCAASTFLANPSLMDLAISNAVTPFAYSLIDPSGKVILIISIACLLFSNRKFNEVLADNPFEFIEIASCYLTQTVELCAMRFLFTLFISLLVLNGFTQDLSGIWRGSFVSADNRLMDMFNLQDRYKYEVQIDQHNKAFSGVTYSYKTTVFYGKASADGTLNPKTGKVMLQELKLLEVKMAPNSEACWMICFMQYSKNGDEEFLEGKYSSYREIDSSFCGRGTVFLRKVTTTDFYKEPFLVKREKGKEQKKDMPLKNSLAQKSSPSPLKPATKIAPQKKSPAPDKATALAKAKLSRPPLPITNATPFPVKPADPKANELIGKDDPRQQEPVIAKPKETIILPPVLKDRENEVVQTIMVNTGEVTINIYDNGIIDHDTVSVYLDKKLILSRKMLTADPLTVKLKMDESNDYHEVVMVAENLGDIPPNTSLMIVKTGGKEYEVRIASTEQKNAVVIFKYQKPK
jgi:hypothetical protein